MTTQFFSTQQILLSAVALFAFIAFLMALRCLAESMLIHTWLKKQYYSEPRINKCPYKFSRASKWFMALLTLKVVE